MKNLLKALGSAIAYIAVYYFINLVIMLIGGMAIGIRAGLEAMTNKDDSMEYISRIIQQQMDENLMLFMTIAGVLSLLTFLLSIIIRKKPINERLDLRPVKIKSLLLVLPFGIALNMLVQIIFELLPIPEEIMQEYTQSTAFLNGEITIWIILSVVIIAPILEEVLYRGLIMKTLKKGMPATMALILQALIFGVMHGQLIWICYATLLGVLFGVLKLRYKSLYPSILLHFSFNASSFLITYFYNLNAILVNLLLLLSIPSSILLAIVIFKRTKPVEPCIQEAISPGYSNTQNPAIVINQDEEFCNNRSQ